MSNDSIKQKRKKLFLKGMRDGVPIGMGYFAVAFTLGITARNAGMNWFQAGLMSALMTASAGEFAALTVIASSGALFEMVLTTIIVNMRYMLMSCALSQKINRERSFAHRFVISHFVTDEFFGIAMNTEGSFEPEYYYGAAIVGWPCWIAGTALGCAVGNILPASISACLGIALYGMFIAIVIPPARKNATIFGVVLISMLSSLAVEYIPLVKNLSSGNKIIILTVLISAIAALVRPVADEPKKEVEA